MLKFAMMLQAIDRVTGPAKRIRASMAGIGQGARKVASDIRSGARSFEFYEGRARRLRQLALGRTFQAIADGAGKAARKVMELAGKLRLVERGAKGLKTLGGNLLGKLGGMATGALKWGGAAAAGGSIFALVDLFGKASQFEQYKIQLEGMEGSATAAKKSFDWVKTFAQKTPYELADVMEAFVQLKAYGIDPLAGSLSAIGDASAGMNKPLMQGVEAVADAITGEYERLKEFGIRASKSGDKVAFTYRKNGKDITKSIKATGTEIESALTGIFRDRFGGMMERQSASFAGMISNLKDAWSGFLVRIADAGIFERVKTSVQGILDRIALWAKDGTLDAWAKQISDSLEKAWNWAEKFINETDWQKVGQDIKTVADAAVSLANGILSIVSAAQVLSLLSSPGLAAAGAPPKGSAPPPKVPNPAAPSWSPAKPAPPRQRIGAANDTKVGGLVRIQVEAKPGTSVRTAGLQSDNRAVPLQVNLGRVMAGAA